MAKTTSAIQITTPGVLEQVECAMPVPGKGEVLITVEACGICGAASR